MPIFYYQQVLPFEAGKKPIELTRDLALVDNFNANLAKGVDEPVLSAEKNTMELLTQLKHHIKATEWKVGNYVLFQGGLLHEKQRVPHRIYDILKLIERAEKGELDPKAAYANIVEKAKEAIDQPRRGRVSSTTAFYKEVYNHSVLQTDYPFKTAEQTPLLSASNSN